VASGNALNITQTTNNAVLNWQDFNIANGYSVNFKQPSSSSATLNNVWSADVSRIAGSLTANGQVYLYNQNGIVFDKGAQINVGSLTASTLKLDPQLFQKGILSNNNGSPTPPAVFESENGADGTPKAGTVTVNQGAEINADGGRIMLLGSTVTNNGKITAPDGQVILGAGKAVYLAASTDPSLRGLLIEVDAQGTSGTVTNTGTISTPRGNATLAGLIVNQAGTVSATTSVSANGSIYLVAGDVSATGSSGPEAYYNGGAQGFGTLLPNKGGELTLAPGSVTTITPDTTDQSTLTQANLTNFIPSQINMVGEVVALQGNAAVRAPGATVSVNAASSPYKQLTSPGNAINDGGRIYLDSASTIDVSGLSEVQVSATREILQVTLESNDLQDDPLLRSGLLHGLAVTVDANRGSTLFNVNPYAGNIALGINEIMTNAGTIKLNSDGDVVARAGSILNVSGGSVAYQGGYGNATTKLLAANGSVYDISTAPNYVQYIGLAGNYSYTDPTWGTKTQATAHTYYAGYLQGKNAGTVSVTAPQMYLQGTLLANTVNGIYQRSPASMAHGGTLNLGCNCSLPGNVVADFRAPSVVFEDGATDTLGANFDYTDLTNTLPNSLQGRVQLSPTVLTQNGFNHFAVFSNGDVTIPAGTAFNLPVNGNLSVTSDQSIEVAGQIRAPGGSVALSTVPVSSNDFDTHTISLADGAVIDVTGNWINDSPRVRLVPGTEPTAIDGGSVTLNAAGDLQLGAGSRIDVSGGGWLNSSNHLNAGKAGSISLTANHAASKDDQTNGVFSGAVDINPTASLLGNSLQAGYGGKLAISSGSLTVGSTAQGTLGELLLDPSFFLNKGFSSYSFTGQNGVTIGGTSGDASVVVNPVQENLAFTGNMFLQRTGVNLADVTQLMKLPDALRAPASITFSSTSVATGTQVLLGENASIVTDPGASVTLTSSGLGGNVTVLGAIVAPAGNITLSLTSTGGDYVPNDQILLGPHAVLAAPAYADIDTLNAKGYRQGSVLSGGTISLQANKGYVVTKPGSLIDVRGTSGTIDVISPTGVTPTVVAGDAGKVLIDAREGIVLQGDLRAQAAAVSGARAGTLVVGLDLFDYTATNTANKNIQNNLYPLNPRTLTLSDKPASALSTFLQSGVAQISTAAITAGGFDDVTLKSADIIAIDGNVSLATKSSLTLDAPLLQGNPNSSLHLQSAYAGLGNYFNQADYFDLQPNGLISTPNPVATTLLSPSCPTASACSATLSVNAGQIDIRGISGWSGFANESLVSSGDVRLTSAQTMTTIAPTLSVPADDNSNVNLRSALNVSGNLGITAQQVYATTNTDFTLTAASSVTFAQAARTAATPLSAGSILTVNAPKISQNGTLRAPIGEITLHAVDTTDPTTGLTTPGSVTLGSGSVTSVSANGMTIPYGSTVNGQQWTYSPNSSVTQVICDALKCAPPAKTVSLQGSDVSVNKGATLDLSGGGDLYAYEWIAGPGGSKDVLASGTYTYAIVPSLGSQFAPVDAQYAQGSKATGNQTIYISGVPGIAAGTYALLPARYALLPGAYAIQVVKTDSNAPAGPAVRQPNGSYAAVGRFGVAQTDVLDSQTSTILVAPGSVVRSQSQYTDSYANAFFSSTATKGGKAIPALPADAGQLQFAATDSLNLNGTINFAAGSYVSGTDSKGNPITVRGVGGGVSIQAPDIRVVDAQSSPAPADSTALQLDVGSLDALGAQTLVLGGTVANTTDGRHITVGSTHSVELDNANTALTGPEVILVAQNEISLDAGARISSSGTLNQNSTALVLSGGSSLLRVASSAAVPLKVATDLPQNPAGILAIGDHASLASTGSLLLYSTGNTTLAPTAAIAAPGVALYSSKVSLGDVPTGDAAPTGLNVTAQLLGQLTGLTSLTIGSTSMIDLYGTVNLGTASSPNPGLANITLDAAAIVGYGAGDKALQANTISLANNGAALSSTTDLFSVTPAGTGSLSLIATGGKSDSIILGTGQKTLQGFQSVSLLTDGAIQGQGTGTLNVGTAQNGVVPLSLQSAAMTGSSGFDQTITTTGDVSINPAAGSVPLAATALGGRLAVVGTSIQQNGTIDLPSGIISLHATAGDVVLGSGSVTRAAGSIQDFTVTSSAADAGRISLTSDAGNVALASGATLDVSGVKSADGKFAAGAGSVSIYAPNGQFSFAGATLLGAADASKAQGDFSLDVGSGLGGDAFSALTSMLASSGFKGQLDLRTRHDSAVAVAGTVKSSSFQLTADSGAIDITGTIDTSGGTATDPDGGAISVWAGNGITLESTARLLANAGAAGPAGSNGSSLSSHGGDITLGTLAGSLDLRSGSQIQLRGSDAGSDGLLTLRAPVIQTDSGPDVAITEIASNITGRNSVANVVVEGYKAYAVAAGGTLSQSPDLQSDPADPASAYSSLSISAGAGNRLFDDAEALLANSAAIDTRLASTNANPTGLNLQLRPGVEIRGAGDLLLNDLWDVNGWSTQLAAAAGLASAPVNLTLRAAGNLIFNNSLSDGFVSNGDAVGKWTFDTGSAPVDSASYRLTAGADLAAANPLATVPQAAGTADVPSSGNFILTPSNLIRTGNGNIQIAAGGDVLLGYGYQINPDGTLQVSSSAPLSSVIYTAGLPAQLTADQQNLFTDPSGSGRNPFVGSFGTHGGNIDISAGTDIRSAASPQLTSDWLWRRGLLQGGLFIDPARNPSVWLVFNNFNQGIGALGGGNITLNAGASVVDVSAVIPTTARLLGAPGTSPTLSNLLVYGGGYLHVRAGGDVASGVFQDDWGNASIQAGGALTSGTTLADVLPGATPTPIYPVLLTGSGVFDVSARSDVTINYIGNSTALPESAANIAAAVRSAAYFYTYAPDDTVNISSEGGSVVLQNQSDNLPLFALNTNGGGFPIILPPTLNVAALSGNISVLSDLDLFPSAKGNLTLLAHDSITGDTTSDLTSHFALTLLETDPTLWPSLLTPQPSLGGISTISGLPGVPLHQTDSQPIYIVAQTGSISGSNMTFPKAADVVAGQDIVDLNYLGKNLNPGDVTLVAAGGNISYTTPTVPVTNALTPNEAQILLGGPGYLEVLAGGNLDLGDSKGIQTTGALADSRLPSTGASLITGAGFGQDEGVLRWPDSQAFTNKYLGPDAKGAPSVYAGQLISFVQQMQGSTGLTYTSALSGFDSLTLAQQLPLLAKVLNNELSQTGLDHTTKGTSYDRGFTAINTLFPTKDAAGNSLTYKGDIDLFFSQLKTEQGGDISLLAPGGSVVVGVPNPPAALNAIKALTGPQPVTAEANLGILILGQGAVNGFADQSFEVNQSRILTLEGGDIILWASHGDIDAGRGAKSASGAPPPVIQTDDQGNVFVNPINDVVGSGIGQLITGPDIKPGLVNLIAPNGTVNAGDAGIRVAGNLNIAAVQVIGANNISVSGTATGVPVSDAGALAGSLSGANSLGDAGKAAVEQLTSNLGSSGDLQRLSDSLTPAFIVVKMFCLGMECESH
jgi:filamentous hemagglutinin family protein